MDFSWPSYYHLTIKNTLPTTVVAGFRVKVDLTLVNELGMFRGDDITAECPLALRVIAVPQEDSENPMISNDIHTDIITKNIRIKPVIEKNGQGTISVLVAPANTLRGEDKIPFLLQVSISPSSRIFPYVIPACGQPMVLVAPDSAAAAEFYASQIDREEERAVLQGAGHEDDDEDEYDDEEEEEYHHHHHVHGEHCNHGHEHDEEDDEDYYDEDDEDMYMDEDDEDAYEEDDDTPPVAMEIDGDLYICEESYELLSEKTHAVYHAFAADQLEHCKPSPKLITLLGEQAKTQQDTSGITVQGMQYRKNANQVHVPASVMNRRQQGVVTRPNTNTTNTTPTTALTFANVKTGFQKEGKAEELLDLQKAAVHILDPLCGALLTTKHITSTTVSSRAALKRVAYAYIRITQGSYIGARIWDGALYMMRTLHRIITQNQVWLDGLRVMEIGAGTGVLGIWLYAMMVQRSRAQIEYVMKCCGTSDNAKEVENILQYLTNKGETSALENMNVRMSNYNIAKALLSYTKPPVMVVTDLGDVMPLLRKNASYNENMPLSSWYRSTQNCVDVFENKENGTVHLEHNRKEVNMYDNAILRSPVGLHALTLDWSKILSPAILKCCGVTLNSSKEGVDFSHDDVFLQEIKKVMSVFPVLKNGSNIVKHYLYNNNMNFPYAFEIIAPHTTDIILASECLYNDRYFAVLKDTICRLYNAHRYAYAQRVFYYNNAVKEYKDYLSKNGLTFNVQMVPPCPTQELPVILLSYRLRATHEEELIADTFFKPLEHEGLFHTSINLQRLLPGSTLHQTIDQSIIVNSAVSQRAKEREDRENQVRNAMMELDVDRRELTRMAVMYPCETNEQGQLVAPIHNMTPNAAFMYKLFQAL